MGVLGLFSADDAAVAIALITAVASLLAPVVVIVVSSLKRIRAAAAGAAHNTQPNGVPDSEGVVGPPSPFDRLMSSHEYMIGQLHAVAGEARAATREATLARAAVKQNDLKTDALAARVDAGFDEAKTERDAIAARLDSTTAALELNVRNGATFVDVATPIVVGMLGRLDRIDGEKSVDALRAQIEAQDGGDG